MTTLKFLVFEAICAFLTWAMVRGYNEGADWCMVAAVCAMAGMVGGAVGYWKWLSDESKS